MIKDDELWGKHKEILEKVKNSIKKEFDSEPVYNKGYLRVWNLIMEKSTQIFTIMKCQKKAPNVFVY